MRFLRILVANQSRKTPKWFFPFIYCKKYSTQPTLLPSGVEHYLKSFCAVLVHKSPAFRGLAHQTGGKHLARKYFAYSWRLSKIQIHHHFLRPPGTENRIRSSKVKRKVYPFVFPITLKPSRSFCPWFHLHLAGTPFLIVSLNLLHPK